MAKPWKMNWTGDDIVDLNCDVYDLMEDKVEYVIMKQNYEPKPLPIYIRWLDVLFPRAPFTFFMKKLE